MEDRVCRGGPSSSPGAWVHDPRPRSYTLRPRTYEYASATSPPEVRWAAADISLASQESLCEAMSARGLERLIIVGDSVSYEFAVSLFHLLNLSSTHRPLLELDQNSSRTVACPEYGRSFQLVFVRNDRLDNTTDASCDHRPHATHAFTRLCVPTTRCCVCDRALHGDVQAHDHGICNPWWEALSDEPAALVLNSGPHWKSRAAFKESVVARALPRVARWQARRPSAVVLWRSTPAGHPHCDAPGLAPLASPPEYSASDLNKYHWDLFGQLDAEVCSAIASWRAWGVLDVVPMTLLRPDGHVGRVRGTLDCLHYRLPSVIDFWSHLLATELLRWNESGFAAHSHGHRVRGG